MKRFLSVFLAALCMLSFCSCSAEETADIVSTIVSEVDESSVSENDEQEKTDEASQEETETEKTEESTTAEETAPPETEPEPEETEPPTEAAAAIDENGVYTTKEDVALYIHTYGKLPSNFITKKEAEALGWPGGDLEPYAPGKCIGGSRFGNYEGLLPEKDGRTYKECDIDTLGASKRGAKRIVFSNDGLIYYTDDHYESFELLYGDEEQ